MANGKEREEVFVKEIPLSNSGRMALVDDDDYRDVASEKWFAVRRHSDPRHEIWVAMRCGERGTVYMHREILGLNRNDGMEVLHVNGNRLDNRKANLVVPGHSVVVRARKFGRGRSRYKGVHKDSRTLQWMASILIAGKTRHLGFFSSEKDAALAYDVAARSKYGRLTALNFPELESRTPPPRIPPRRGTAKPTTMSSQYRGVCWHKRAGKWQATTKLRKRLVYLGIFSSEEDAAKAYDIAVRRLRGHTAKTNFA
jgi:hypothetical protein